MQSSQPLTTVASDREPRIASSVVSGVRRTLIDLGEWKRVRGAVLALRPDADGWVDSALDHQTWCPADWHFVVMSAIRLELGESGAREFGAARLRDNLQGGRIAPILRSWMRSYGSAPGHLLRVAPYVWNAVTRALGRIDVSAAHEREIQFRAIEMPECARRCTGWHRFLEGYVVAWLAEGSHPSGRIEIVTGPAPGQLEARVTW